MTIVFNQHIYQHLLIVTQKLVRCKFNELHTIGAVTHWECVETSS